MTAGEHRIRVRVLDGKKVKYGKVKANLGNLDVIDTGDGLEFIVCAAKKELVDSARAKLAAAGLKEVAGSTDFAPPQPAARPQTWGAPPAQRAGPQSFPPQQSTGKPLPPKPYGFVPLPTTFSTAAPIWHDGTSSEGRLSGEIRFELENLTPLLAGWERRSIEEDQSLARYVQQFYPDGKLPLKKSVLCPLRAPWGDRPVIITGDSLKGLVRHELGALLGAPMERVAERSYSYRPNSLFPNRPNSRLMPRLARVPQASGVEMRDLGNGKKVRVPIRLELLDENLKYDRKSFNPPAYRFDPYGGKGARYHGGLGAGVKLNSKRNLHNSVEAIPAAAARTEPVPATVQAGYLNTLRHLTDIDSGHFSERHPDVPETVTAEEARDRILQAAQNTVFSPGDMVWVEWDKKKNQIVSVGWHYYYRWAYLDSVRHTGGSERQGLYALNEERCPETEDMDKAPERLSPVRRLFGYTGDNDGSKGIGKGNYSQLMGRIAINSALEVITPDGSERFLPPVFLKELGMPRPSAVEYYLEQPYYQNHRPSDSAKLVTYGDAAGYDAPGSLCGRKVYLDRADAHRGRPWEDDSTANRRNERSTLALEASPPGRRFRFTLRFRDLDPDEVSAVLLALCPDQFRKLVGGTNSDGYCSKLGYARPLGWGTVRIEAKDLLLLKFDPTRLERQPDVTAWFKEHFKAPPLLRAWLKVHRCNNPDAGEYPRSPRDGEIFTFHTTLRAEHSRERRYDEDRR